MEPGDEGEDDDGEHHRHEHGRHSRAEELQFSGPSCLCSSGSSKSGTPLRTTMRTPAHTASISHMCATAPLPQRPAGCSCCSPSAESCAISSVTY